jgi:hypothetical protein
MRPLLAVIVLFAAQNSLFATLVYRYELTFFDSDTGTYLPPEPQGSEGSGYIDVLTPTGNNVPVLDAVYDIQFRGFIGTDGNGVLPAIPAPIFSSLDGCTISGPEEGTPFMDWGETRLSGLWAITAPIARTEDGEFLALWLITDHTVESYWPLEYYFNESMRSGDWIFTGARNVPEPGQTSVYLAISVVALAVFRWRQLNWSR